MTITRVTLDEYDWVFKIDELSPSFSPQHYEELKNFILEANLIIHPQKKVLRKRIYSGCYICFCIFIIIILFCTILGIFILVLYLCIQNYKESKARFKMIKNIEKHVENNRQKFNYYGIDVVFRRDRFYAYDSFILAYYFEFSTSCIVATIAHNIENFPIIIENPYPNLDDVNVQVQRNNLGSNQYPTNNNYNMPPPAMGSDKYK